jgi:EmrB/QacA subfamily drug resistance transporter
MNITMVIVAMPAIFNAFQFSTGAPDAISYIIWLITGYLIVTATMVVTFGKLSDMLGRVKLYNVGFVIFTIASVLLSAVTIKGDAGILELIIYRMVQAVGGGLLMVNGPAILTDYFPIRERGKAMGLNQISSVAGTILGLVLGGLFASISWNLIFIINIPFGMIGIIWSYISLKETVKKSRIHIDWLGNLVFVISLLLILIGITYGLVPYGKSSEGWTNPFVVGSIIIGILALGIFVLIEKQVKEPMFDISLFKIRDFWTGNLSLFIVSLTRQGLILILIMLFQGIWLPLNGYSYASTPFWSGIYTMPFMLAFIAMGPVSGYLSDKYGGRIFTIGGLLATAFGFLLLTIVPYNFNYIWFVPALFIIGAGMALFSSPNTADIMSSVPRKRRSAASGMRTTITNCAMAVSFPLYFAIIFTTMGGALPNALSSTLHSSGAPSSIIPYISSISPTEALFSALLGYNPVSSILSGLPEVTAKLSGSIINKITSLTFFPEAIGSAYMRGFREVVMISAILLIISAVVSYFKKSGRRS